MKIKQKTKNTEHVCAIYSYSHRKSNRIRLPAQVVPKLDIFGNVL